MDKVFDPLGWTYEGRHATLQQLDRILAHDEALLSRAQEALIIGGGKALGLELCARIAQADRRLHVPPWRWIDAVEQMDIAREIIPIESALAGIPSARDRLVLVRSSEPEEDWGDPRSGVAESMPAPVQSMALAMAFGKIARDSASVVVQHIVTGIGVVVDIAWSELLGCAVARTKTGRVTKDAAGRTHFTSGTWDVEGLSRIWDPATGEPLLPTHEGVQLTRDAERIPVGEIVQALTRGLRKAGLTFGVQVEVIVHPDEPTVWHLVQVRPSPDALRHPPHVVPDSTVIAVTPGTTGACDVTAPLIPVTPQDALEAMRLGSGMEELAVIERTVGRILLWEHIPSSEDYWISAVQELSRAGVSGHITRGIMLINTTHGKILRGANARNQRWDEINRNAAVVGVEPIAFETLHKLAKHTHTSVRIVSDGIVALVTIPSPAPRR